MALKKRYKIPEIWDANTAAAIDQMFEELYREVASKYTPTVTEKPGDTVGNNGETRIDETNNKIYVKIKGTWKEASLS